MAKTVLARRIESLNEALEGVPDAKSLRGELLHLVVTCRPGAGHAELVRAAAAVRRKGTLQAVSQLTPASMRLAKTIWAISQLGIPHATAQKQYGARESEARAALALAEAAGIEPGDLSAKVHPSRDAWAADLEHGRIHAVVTLAPAAVQDLLFAAAEGYRVPVKTRRRGPGRPPPDYTVVYGLCFGTRTERPRTPEWKGKDVYYTVERCFPQLRAEMKSFAVGWNAKSTEVAAELARTVAPHWELLGDFHSHPYRTVDRMREAEGWEYSSEDEDVNAAFIEQLKRLKHRPVLGLVVAVARKKNARAGRRVRAFGDHTAQFTIGGHQFVLAAYVNPVSHRYSRARELRCASPL